MIIKNHIKKKYNNNNNNNNNNKMMINKWIKTQKNLIYIINILYLDLYHYNINIIFITKM